MAKKYWVESLGRIELEMTQEQAEMVPLSGQADDGVLLLSQEPDIQEQLNDIDDNILMVSLLEYGAWDINDLQDRETNIQRLLWIAACDIQEQDDE